MIKTKNDVKYVTLDSFKDIDFISLYLSTKIGGVSEGCYSSMNLSFTMGDTDENVYENYKTFCETLNINYEFLQRGYQTHGTNVAVVKKEDVKKFSKTSYYEDTDALVTNVENVPLVTFFADCVPVFFVDTKNRAIGVAHAGWRGTNANIVKNVIDKMKEEYNTDPKDVICGIGQSIHKCCFLVDDDVYSIFNKTEDYRKYIEKVGNKYSIDLQGINKHNLMIEGVQEENIEIDTYCTCCEKDIFFSHRREGVNRGTMAGFLSILP